MLHHTRSQWVFKVSFLVISRILLFPNFIPFASENLIVLFVNEVLLNLSSLILIPEPDVYMFILNLKRMQLLQLLPTCMI